MLCLTFPENGFNFVTQKFAKKLKNTFFRRLEHSFFSSSLHQNHFLGSFLWQNFDLNRFEHFASPFQKMVRTSSLKNLQKCEKWPFQTLRTFIFEVKVASKKFSKKFPMARFWFKQLWTLCLAFPENGFTFITQKFAKNWKMPFSSAQNSELKLPAKPFYKKVLMTKFWFK